MLQTPCCKHKVEVTMCDSLHTSRQRETRADFGANGFGCQCVHFIQAQVTALVPTSDARVVTCMVHQHSHNYYLKLKKTKNLGPLLDNSSLHSNLLRVSMSKSLLIVSVSKVMTFTCVSVEVLTVKCVYVEIMTFTCLCPRHDC